MLEAYVIYVNRFVLKEFNIVNVNNKFKYLRSTLEPMAKMEHELTVKLIRKDMAKAKRYGTRSCRPIGRPPREIPASFKKYYPMWKKGAITATDFAKLVDVSRPTLYQFIHESESR